MVESTLSSKYQLVIPKEIREETGIKKNERFIIIAKDGVIKLIPKHKVKDLRGFIKGMKVEGFREDEDRI